MSIDEAIDRFKGIANNARNDIIDGDNLEPQESHYNAQLELYAKEHEQLAEWLEEMKTYRENSNGYRKEDIELNRNAMYNKAIDDFVAFTKEHEYKYGNADITSIVIGFNEFIAEQLKGGVSNENCV